MHPYFQWVSSNKACIGPADSWIATLLSLFGWCTDDQIKWGHNVSSCHNVTLMSQCHTHVIVQGTTIGYPECYLVQIYRGTYSNVQHDAYCLIWVKSLLMQLIVVQDCQISHTGCQVSRKVVIRMRRLSDMKCTVMIWRLWVRTPVGLNLGCAVLLSKVVL